MESKLWKQVSEVFQSALKLEPNEREVYLAEACAENRELRGQVESLLHAYNKADRVGFIDVPATEQAATLLISDPALTGETVGHYTVVRRLGSGGMGEVYLAEDTTLGRLVAIKFLLTETAHDKERIKRFLREARAASALNHPNILTVYHIGEHRGSHFFASEYIHGETLRNRLGEAPFPVRDVLEIAVQVASALDAAHGAGIIHRDIKPENIMIRDDGLVKVLDFGLAKLTGSDTETGTPAVGGAEARTLDHFHTRAGMIMGTAGYMSPEQARGLEVDSRSDIWSLGVVMYEMIGGRQPFVGETASESIDAILRNEPAPLPDVPVELNLIISRTLKKNPDERFQTVKDLVMELRELKQDLEFEAKLEKSGTAAPDKLTAQTQIQPQTTDSGAGLARRIKTLKFATVGVVLFLLLALSTAYYLAGGSFSKYGLNVKTIGSVAVIPFVNEGRSADLEYLSDGITDSLINSLSLVPGLTVKARSSVFQYKGKEVSPQTIGSELSVQAALFGRVTQLNDVLTISLELVDTRSGDRIWGELYSRKQADLVSLQGEITRDVANKLGARLAAVREKNGTRPETANPDAYNLYLQGLYFLNKRTADDIRKSIALFDQATEKDPDYAKAYAYLASAYITLRPYDAGLSRQELKELASKAQAAVQRAQELDDSLPEVHSILGTFNDINWKFAEAENEYVRAIQLNPNDAAVRSAYSLNLSIRGRHEEALAEVSKAYQLDPLSRSIAFNVGARYQEARRFDEAIAQFRRVLEMEPNHPLTHFILAYTYEAKGMYAEAIQEHRASDLLLKKAPAEASDRKAGALLQALEAGGAEGYWRKRLEFNRREYGEERGSAYDTAIAFARLGDRDGAIEHLERSFAGHELYLPWLRTQSAFDTLSEDPRFIDLVRRIGLLD